MDVAGRIVEQPPKNHHWSAHTDWRTAKHGVAVAVSNVGDCRFLSEVLAPLVVDTFLSVARARLVFAPACRLSLFQVHESSFEVGSIASAR